MIEIQSSKQCKLLVPLQVDRILPSSVKSEDYANIPGPAMLLTN